MLSKTAQAVVVTAIITFGVARCGVNETPEVVTVTKHDTETITEQVTVPAEFSQECLDLIKYTRIAYEDDDEISRLTGKFLEETDHATRDLVAAKFGGQKELLTLNRQVYDVQQVKAKLDTVLMDRTGAQQSVNHLVNECEATLND